jgi:hypothetical protein
MWWALPFTDDDAYAMQILGYSDEWIRWMRSCHDANTRTLLVSSVIGNAIKLGRRINHHYENNELFRDVFSEVIPDSSCPWSAQTMTHKRDFPTPDGEGTYDFIGVGAALQSRHYPRIIEDDLVGKEAIESEAVMEKTIAYHQLLPGAFDADPNNPDELNDEIVVGNRWGIKDLNSWIRENETWFRIHSHSATGGCCSDHPTGKPIFPEEYSLQKLDRLKIREGVFHYSCQYENNPIPEGEVEFQPDWLNYYELAPVSKTDNRAKFVHEVKNGCVLPDIMPADLQIELLADPRHANNEKAGRCRHAIVVVGYMQNPQRFYLIDQWAEHTRYQPFVDKIYEFAAKYKLPRIWLETIAAQEYLKLYLEYKNRVENINLRVESLDTDNSPNAKLTRIRSMNPYYASGQFYIRRSFTDWYTEYSLFPFGKTIDLLDITGYAPQVMTGRASTKQIMKFMQAQQERFNNAHRGVTGY